MRSNSGLVLCVRVLDITQQTKMCRVFAYLSLLQKNDTKQHICIICKDTTNRNDISPSALAIIRVAELQISLNQSYV